MGFYYLSTGRIVWQKTVIHLAAVMFTYNPAALYRLTYIPRNLRNVKWKRFERCCNITGTGWHNHRKMLLSYAVLVSYRYPWIRV